MHTMQNDVRRSAARIKTRVNGEWIKDVAYYPLKVSIPELNERAGLASNYLYRLLDDAGDANPTIDTLDRIANALADRYVELHLPPPDDIWESLTVHNRESE